MKPHRTAWMRFPFRHFAFLILPVLAWADAPSDLRASLQRLQGHLPVRVSLSYATWQETNREKKSELSQASLQLRAGEEDGSLHVDWSLPQLEAANLEERNRDKDSRLATPFRDAMKDLDAGRLSHLLNQAEVLSHLLDATQFKEERSDNYQGKPARVLVFTFKPRIAPAHQARVSRSEATLKIWIGADGVPLATESLTQYEGRHSRFFGLFRSRSRVETTYGVLNGRLVVATRTSEDSLADSGDETKSKKTLTLAEVGP